MKHPALQSPNQKTRVFLLTGFLGSGKTTLLKRILSWETDLSDTVILVNEFGDVGIDGDLLKNSGSDVIELISGCICCSLRNDLRRSLSDILKQHRPKQIFIEASGVADPTTIKSVLLEPPLAELIQLEKIVTVLDADYWEVRENFGQLFFKQLEMASLILLNKVDLIDKITIPAYLKEIHEIFPHSQLVPTVRCCIDPEMFWLQTILKENVLKPIHLFHDVSLYNLLWTREDRNDSHQPYGAALPTQHFVTFSFEHSQIIDETCFHHFVDTLPLEVFRMKGSVRFDNRTEIINFVGGKGEWSKCEGAPETRLAFVGWNITPAEILGKLYHCIAMP